MSIQHVFIASLLAILGYASAAFANSCSNVVTLGTYDQSGLMESQYGISAVGTFRIEGEEDESKQPDFNLAFIGCEKQFDDTGKVSLECKVTRAAVQADKGNPDTDNPNCTRLSKSALLMPVDWALLGMFAAEVVSALRPETNNEHYFYGNGLHIWGGGKACA
jgi:hypothetical protein